MTGNMLSFSCGWGLAAVKSTSSLAVLPARDAGYASLSKSAKDALRVKGTAKVLFASSAYTPQHSMQTGQTTATQVCCRHSGCSTF